MENNHLLDCLFSLTELEQERSLTEQETAFYVYCYDKLNSDGVEIPFSVEI